MRTACIIAPKIGPVYGTKLSLNCARTVAADRLANDDAFPGEIVVRLPRRLGIDHAYRIRPAKECRTDFSTWCGD